MKRKTSQIKKKKLKQIRLLAIFFAIVLIEIITLFFLSRKLSPDISDTNPTNILGKEAIHFGLGIFGFLLFFTITFAFTRAVFINQRKKMGLQPMISKKSVLYIVVQLLFISLLFILVDISLINVFTLHGLVVPTWLIVIDLPLDFATFLPRDTDLIAYATYRAYFFIGFLSVLLLFPIASMIAILTRYGRKKLNEIDAKSLLLAKSPLISAFYKGISIIVVSIGIIVMSYLLIINPASWVSILVLGSVMIALTLLFLAVFFLLLDMLRRLLRLSFAIGGYNIMMSIPVVFIFYILPVLLWTFWDLFVILSRKTTERTVYDTSNVVVGIEIPNIDPSTYTLASSPTSLIELGIQTLKLNFFSPIRIYELDFIFIVGISAIVLGFAEGFSVISIFKRMLSGIRGGESIGTIQGSTALFRLGQSLLLLSWTIIAWDRFVGFFRFLGDEFGFNFGFEFLVSLDFIFSFLQGYPVPQELVEAIILFVVPLYIIFVSSLKFFSITLVMDKVKDDLAIFLLLISSAFTLIVTKIYSDISELPQFDGPHKKDLPFEILQTNTPLPFVMKIFRNIESIAFYAGVGWAIIYAFRSLKQKLQDKKKNKELEFM